jgi:alkaline phosphatase
MLPAPSVTGPSLAAVVPSSLAAIAGGANPFGLPAVRSAVVLLVDGLGAAALSARAGHARTLAPAMGRADVIHTVFPTTTAAALGSLTTGASPGQHGLVGYTILDPANDRIVNALTGWGPQLDPDTWQRRPTLFEGTDVDPVAIGPARYSDSGFTHAVLRGARYIGARSIAERLSAAATAAAARPALVYVYVAELDQAAHQHGWQSPQWTAALEEVDSAVRSVLPALDAAGAGLLVTADHGILDVPEHAQVLFGGVPELMAGVRHVAGEPRNLQLHLEPGADGAALAAAWRESEGERAWVATRDEAIDAGWFGEVDAEVRPRIGDVVVAARKAVAYYQHEHDGGRSMIGQHGSLSPEELRVPLLRFSGFGR